jgi:UDP-glucose 4-epimerase
LNSGTGYIGSFTALALLEAGYKVVITDNLYNSSPEVVNRIELICGKRAEFEKLDIRDEKALDAVFEKHPDIDSVIHFAALKVRQSDAGELLAFGLTFLDHRQLAKAPKYHLTTISSMFMARSASYGQWPSTMSPTLSSLPLQPCTAMQLDSLI